MNKIANRKVVCETLLNTALSDSEITVLCSDSRGSASITQFFEKFPTQALEIGIAEQNIVGIAAGLASCGKKPFVFSPASFLTTRSYEQCKVDVAYSNNNVKLIGISGGISYGALGMTHHSAQDIAAMCAIPNMRVYLPSDRFQTAKLILALLNDNSPAYIRIGRNPVQDIYSEEDCPFVLNKANVLHEGSDITLIACGELVKPSLDATKILKDKGISATILDMHCLKPLDKEAIIKATANSKVVFTVEEHSPFGGLGSLVSLVVSENTPKHVYSFALPDEPVITGTSQEVFEHYELDSQGIAGRILNIISTLR